MFSTVSFRLFVIVFRCFRFKDDNFLKETCIELHYQYKIFRIYQKLYSVFYPKVIRGIFQKFRQQTIYFKVYRTDFLLD